MIARWIFDHDLLRNDTNTTYVCSVFEANRTQVAYAIGSGWDYDKCYVILRYTKTS